MLRPAFKAPLLALGLGAMPLAIGCDDAGTADPSDEAPTLKGTAGSADASAQAVVIDLAFKGELVSSHCFNTRQAIQDQLLYTIGQLNGHNSVGRLDRLELSNITSRTDGGLCKIGYDARLPVAWGKKNDVPRELELVLPKDNTYEGLERFVKSYSSSCVDWGAHDVTAGSMWYYYRPLMSGCRLADADVVRTKAAVSVSPVNTTGKYPEYDKVWEDGALRVVAVFGKYEDGATTNDAGIDAYNRFVATIAADLRPYSPTTVPATVPANPGVAVPDIVFNATLPDGKTVEIVSLMVDNVRTAGAAFDARYEALSSRADLIVYNGHAGLGANVRALAAKGHWVAGQYVIVFMNGCDTYTYIDTALFDAHAEVNSDDPEGTKYVDIVTNAMPSFFHSMAGATTAMVRGLLDYDEPRTYERIFADIDAREVVIVTGEHDNTFVPGDAGGGDADVAWAGMSDGGKLATGDEKRHATAKLGAGRYRFALSGTGDADLYVRVGDAPSQDLWDCRPYLGTSNETCEVELASATTIHVLVDAYRGPIDFKLAGTKVR